MFQLLELHSIVSPFFKGGSVWVLLLFPLASAFALPDDPEKTIHITADSSFINYKTGVNIYEGNVIIDQGSTHLTADKLITKNNTQHKMQEAIAYGTTQLAKYTTLPKTGDKLFVARAKTITFYPLKSMVIMEGETLVTQGENSFHGPVITYNIKDQIITAPASKNGRATIIIEPKQIN